MKTDRVDDLIAAAAAELGVDFQQHVKGDPVAAEVYSRFGCVVTLLLLRRVRDLENAVCRLEDAVTGAEWINLAKCPDQEGSR